MFINFYHAIIQIDQVTCIHKRNIQIPGKQFLIIFEFKNDSEYSYAFETGEERDRVFTETFKILEKTQQEELWGYCPHYSRIDTGLYYRGAIHWCTQCLEVLRVNPEDGTVCF